MGVLGVKVLAPDGVKEPVEWNGPRFGIANEIGGDTDRSIAGPAGVFAIGGGCVEFVARFARMVEWRGIRGLVGINITGDAVADGVRPVRGVRPDRVIMGAIPGMVPAIEWDRARLLHGENIASNAVGMKAGDVKMEDNFRRAVIDRSGTRRSP